LDCSPTYRERELGLFLFGKEKIIIKKKKKTMETEYASNVVSTSLDMNHAQRYMDLVAKFDRLTSREIQKLDLYEYLVREGHIRPKKTMKNLLNFWITHFIRKNKSVFTVENLTFVDRPLRTNTSDGTVHIHRIFTGLKGEYRRDLPASLKRLIGYHSKVNPLLDYYPLTWKEFILTNHKRVGKISNFQTVVFSVE